MYYCALAPGFYLADALLSLLDFLFCPDLPHTRAAA